MRRIAPSEKENNIAAGTPKKRLWKFPQECSVEPVAQQTQLAMNDVPTFKGNVKSIRTDVLVDRAAEDLYPTWENNREQWNLTGGDHPSTTSAARFGSRASATPWRRR